MPVLNGAVTGVGGRQETKQRILLPTEQLPGRQVLILSDVPNFT